MLPEPATILPPSGRLPAKDKLIQKNNKYRGN